MSLAIQVARRAGHMGDPGIFDFIGKAIGSVAKIAAPILPGPLGGVARLAGNILAPPKPVSVAKAGTIFGKFPQGTPPILRAQTGSGVSVGPGGVTIGTWGQGAPQLAPGGQQYTGGGVTGPVVGTRPSTPCVAGHHFNKSGYYTKRYGYVEAGTVCVRNRRRNPLNPRALSRAMSRVKSAQRAVRCLQLFAGPAARASAKNGGKRRRGCRGGCKR